MSSATKLLNALTFTIRWSNSADDTLIIFIVSRKQVSPYFTIVQIIFHFLWDHWAHCGIFENEILFMYTLESVSSVANFITAYEKSHKTETSIF